MCLTDIRRRTREYGVCTLSPDPLQDLDFSIPMNSFRIHMNPAPCTTVLFYSTLVINSHCKTCPNFQPRTAFVPPELFDRNANMIKFLLSVWMASGRK